MKNEPLEPGWIVGNWKIERKLGHGQSGEVYQVRERNGERRRAALKILRGARSLVAPIDFKRESHFLAQQNAPGIFPAFYEEGEHEGMPFFVMELLEALPKIHTSKCFIGNALSLIDTVERLHRKGWFHADIKPENIARKSKEIRLLDCGSVCTSDDVSRHLIRIGTRRYMAPEVESGGQVSALSEIYSIGVTLHDLCPERLRPIFDPVLARATATDPRSRTPSLQALREELEAALPNFRARAAQATRLPRYRTLVKWASISIASAILFAFTVFGGMMFTKYLLKNADIRKRHGRDIETSGYINGAIFNYEIGDLPKALWFFERGFEQPGFTTNDYPNVNIRGIYHDCKRRLLDERSDGFSTELPSESATPFGNVL